MKTITSLLALSTALFMASCNTSPSDNNDEGRDTLTMEEYSAESMPMNNNVEMSDTAFIRQAGEGGLSEVTLAKLAKEKASDSQVKSFADQMLADHSKANDKLKAIANRKGYTVPTALPQDKQKVVDELSSKSGAEFDKAYVEQMVKDHENTVSLFTSAEGLVEDSDLSGFVREMLPTLEQHLMHAKDLNQ